MGKTYDVSWPKPNPKDGQKPFWIKVGKAFENDSGTISVRLDAVPINWDGELRLFPNKE